MAVGSSPFRQLRRRMTGRAHAENGCAGHGPPVKWVCGAWALVLLGKYYGPHAWRLLQPTSHCWPSPVLEVGVFLWQAGVCEHHLRQDTRGDGLRILLVADTHILGPLRRHWVDIRWSDWGIYKALASAVWVHTPDVVIVNGDVFDEGNIASAADFRAASARFHRIFAVGGLTRMRDKIWEKRSLPQSAQYSPGHPSLPLLFAGSGNHDVGLGYAASEYLVHRFTRNVSRTQVVECVGNVSLVFLNTQVLHPSSSKHLREAETALISDPGVQAEIAQCSGQRRPILFQHMPLYRVSDAYCGEARHEGSGEEMARSVGRRESPNACLLHANEDGSGAWPVGVNTGYSPGYCFGESGGVTYKGRHERLASPPPFSLRAYTYRPLPHCARSLFSLFNLHDEHVRHGSDRWSGTTMYLARTFHEKFWRH
jgi:hypothetical protein